MADAMRIQRALARAGVASRRKAEELVAEGRVTVNGEVATLGQSVEPRDRIAVDGTLVAAPKRTTWLVLNKPSGVMTTKTDPEGRKTVFDLVKDAPGLTYVGRLDLLTEGVLLLTNDGTAAHRLTHPSTEIERVYVALVRGNAMEAAESARRGVELEDGLVQPAWVQVRPAGSRRWEFEVAIREGRNREVRRLCEALGLVVDRLVRTQFGPVRLGNLAIGETRALSSIEREFLETLTGTEIPAAPRQQRGARKSHPQRSPARRERGESTSSRDAVKRESSRPPASRVPKSSKEASGKPDATPTAAPRRPARGPRGRGA